MFTKDRGFVKLSVVLAVVFGIGFGASAYLNYAQHEASKQEQTQLQGQVTDLTYQLKQDTGASANPAPSSSNQPDPSPSPSPSTTPAVAGTASIAISQFGVHFTVTDPVTDLTYSPEPSGDYTVAAFTTQSLRPNTPPVSLACWDLSCENRRMLRNLPTTPSSRPLAGMTTTTSPPTGIAPQINPAVIPSSPTGPLFKMAPFPHSRSNLKTRLYK